MPICYFCYVFAGYAQYSLQRAHYVFTLPCPSVVRLPIPLPILMLVPSQVSIFMHLYFKLKLISGKSSKFSAAKAGGVNRHIA